MIPVKSRSGAMSEYWRVSRPAPHRLAPAARPATLAVTLAAVLLCARAAADNHDRARDGVPREEIPAPPDYSESAEAGIPEPPRYSEGGESLEPEVTIRRREKATITEYRVNGRLTAIKVEPDNAPVYYLVDTDGDGNLETRTSAFGPQFLIPSWIIFSW